MSVRLRTFICVAAVVAIVSVLTALYFVDPEISEFMPKCAFRLLTGLDCPSCGSQRAVHAMLHGEFSTALSYNPFIVLSFPYFAAELWGYMKRVRWSGVMRRYAHHRIAMTGYVVIFCVWWIVRNL